MASPSTVALWGGLSFGAAIGAMLLAVIAGLNEPYRTIGAYFAETLRPRAAAIFLFLFPWGLWTAIAMPSAWKWGRESAIRSIRVRVIALSPLIVAPILMAWSPLHMLAKVAGGNFDVLAGKPAWVYSPLLQIPGSILTPLLALGLWLWWTAWALRRLDEMWEDGRCRGCGYDRCGLAIAAVCPECGVQPQSCTDA
jgi:hypothetical protein